jgi:hypothetical protein
MLRHRRHASGVMTSCNHPPASPGPLARAWGLTRVAPSIGPTRGVRRHQQRPRHPVVPGGTVPWTSLPAPCGGARGTSAYDIAAAVSSCCGLATAAVTRDGSPVAVTLAAVYGTLSERRLVIEGIPDLSALAGGRAGTVGVTLSTRKQNSKRPPLKTKGVRGEMLLTSNWKITAFFSSRAGGVPPSR